MREFITWMESRANMGVARRAEKRLRTLLKRELEWKRVESVRVISIPRYLYDC